MDPGHTTLSVQRYLDELRDLRGDAPSEPVVRELLGRAVDRLKMLCESMLYRSYPRLMMGPLNLSADELLGGVAERLIKAMRQVRPGTVRQFFALANQHLRWELNDLARRLDQRVAAAELHDSQIAAPPEPSSQGTAEAGITAGARRILDAIEGLPEEEREAFNLVRIQGMTIAEAASIVGASESTVKRRVGRSLVLLAERLPDLRPPPVADGTHTSTSTS